MFLKKLLLHFTNKFFISNFKNLCIVTFDTLMRVFSLNIQNPLKKSQKVCRCQALNVSQTLARQMSRHVSEILL
jgi:uncharacterized membrane protein affecting hemolysin expression